MNNKFHGPFSLGLMTLQLQLANLLQGAGGDDAAAALDSLSQLKPAEQKIALTRFNNVLKRILSGNVRLEAAADKDLENFEESLYQDLVAGLYEASASPKLEVLNGGKDASPITANTPIDLDQARKIRKLRDKPVLN